MATKEISGSLIIWNLNTIIFLCHFLLSLDPALSNTEYKICIDSYIAKFKVSHFFIFHRSTNCIS